MLILNSSCEIYDLRSLDTMLASNYENTMGIGQSKLTQKNIEEAITRLEALPLKDADEKDIQEIIKKLITGYQSSIPSIPPNFTVYRARIIDGNNPELVSEISYLPAKYVKGYNRGSSPGQSAFYCSDQPFAPFLEVKCKDGDLVALSTWRTKSHLVLNHIGFTKKTGTMLKSTTDISGVHAFVSRTKNHSELNSMIYEYLAFIFSRPIEGNTEEIYYKLTSSIANIMMSSEVIQGLLYPTVQMWANANNILLKPSFVDEHMDFVNVEVGKIRHENGNYIFDRIDSATNANMIDGKLAWSGRPLEWNITKRGMYTAEGTAKGVWAIREPSGNVLDQV